MPDSLQTPALTEEEMYQHLPKLGQVFRPGAPVDRQSLFSGRLTQMRDVLEATYQPGQHVILFGERGVGKTSLARVISDVVANTPGTGQFLNSGTINCDGTDDFSALWHKVFRELSLVMEKSGIGFNSQATRQVFRLDNLLNERVTPDDVRFALSRLSGEVIIILDEIDRIKNKDTTTAMLADTIKNLSDHTLNVTLIMIGVADTVDQLITEHKSVERSLV